MDATKTLPKPAWSFQESEAAAKWFKDTMGILQQVTWTVAPATNTPYEFGKWWGTTGDSAQAAMWYADTADMIDYLAGWLETHTAQDDKRLAAQGLFEQLTITDGMTFDEWRFGL